MDKIIFEQGFYTTSNLALAAVLSLSFPLEAVDRRSSDQPLYTFKRGRHLDELIEQYWREELRVEPQMYYRQVERLLGHASADRAGAV